MDERALSFVAEACAGQLAGGEGRAHIERVSTDSRQTRAGDLFVALQGERFDGHNFLRDAAARGAAAAMVRSDRKDSVPSGLAAVLVDDTRAALGRLAARYRRDFKAPAIAIGGSNGKTTTKELIASVLKKKLKVLFSPASFNNDIGVPLTLLQIEPAHQALVLEVGTNHPGELSPLVQMIQPRFGVITSLGREHLEFFGDIAGVVEEQGWLAELLPEDGVLFMNGDSEWAAEVAGRSRARVVRAGLKDTNEWRARGIRLDQDGTMFRVESPRVDYDAEYRLKLVGRHQVSNALLAIAVGAEMGLSQSEIARGLAECEPVKMRLQMWELNGVRVLDDAYNANADSMDAALQTLKEMPCRGRKVAVLGDMAELGAHNEAAHEEVGRRAAELGVGQLFAVGKMAPVMARGARGAGLNRVMEFTDVESAAVAIKSFLKTGDLLLLKASRSTRLERISELLRSGETVRKN
jgi:UDP-N-acetylmuramoyl-tripeptide--D-alanyl-D-alanine ligase